VKRALRKILRMPDEETPEERETRERLEFFQSHSDSEIVRLAEWFHSIVKEESPGMHEIKITEPVVPESVANVWSFGFRK